jgi:diamine N-acetyltransferase
MSAMKVRLRAVENGDLESTRRWRNDPTISLLTIGRPFPITALNELAWFESLGSGALPTNAVWAVDAGTGIVGVAQINDIDWIHRTAWFGIFIGTEHQGNGFGRAATELACDHAFERFNLRQIRLRVRADNTAAIALYDSLGFELEGTHLGAVLVGEVAVDVCVMRRSRPLATDPRT